MIKVAKFGGSSVANAEQFRKVKQIISSDPDRKFVVSSACGKESNEDHKVTDLLFLCEAHVRFGVSYEPIFEQIEAKYQRIKAELGLKTDLDSEFASIRKVMKRGMSTDYLVSRGEYLTSRLLAEYLDYDFADAAEVIAFRYDGEVDMDRTRQLIEERISEDRGLVIPGFYGALPNGVIRIMSRGGSDITGAIVSNVVNADVYENWTDVSGFLVADPRIVKNPIGIPCINYNELREMSYMGANVLHDDAIFPVKDKNIPINVRNTNDPSNPGTLIMADCSEKDRISPPHAITGITGRKDYTIITLVKSHASAEVGFLRKLLKVFENYHVSIEAVPSTVDTFSVIVASKEVEHCLYDIVGELKENLGPDDVRIEDHLALIAIVGRAMKDQPGMSGRLLSEFGDHQINIKVISQSSDELSIMVGVHNRDFEKAIHSIYERFITEEQEAK
ncbi:MAG: aspartate kinase [Solobacterium sp.]|nr:aspartate kinase [Solobacterium sp.]